MRSLYVKVFAAFWLVMTLVVGANMLVTWLLARQFEDPNSRHQQLEQLAEQAVSRYLEGGATALGQWQRQLYQQSELRTLLLDTYGRNLSGGPLPPRLRYRLQRMLEPHSEFERHDHEHDDDDYRHPPPRRHFRPLILPLKRQAQQFRFIVLNPHELLDHLYSGHILAWRIGLSLLLVALLSVAMARYLIRPIRQLQHTSQLLAEGRLDSRVDSDVSARRDELGQLACDFNRMAEQVEGLLAGQQQLLRDVSHELRTPLARLRVALELARKKPDPSAELDRIEKQAEELDRLIAEILMLARLDAGASSLVTEPTALDELIRDCVADFNLDQHRIHFSSQTSPILAVSPKLIRRALDNIIGNALKYSDQPVQVSLETESESIWIRVQDQGPGVEASMLKQIFEPFVRTDQARSREHGGWGLGLAIASRAIRQHRGEISARNLKPQGLEISITLPINGSVQE